MPTFSSIGMHPQLRNRLVTVSKHDPQHHLVTTPQALLSRNPGQLRLLNEDGSSSRPIAGPQVLKLRYEVATALIAQTKTAIRHLQRIRKRGEEPEDEAVTKRARLQIPGTASALELLRYESSLNAAHAVHGTSTPAVLHTGCRKLDKMIALTAQYSLVSTRMDIPSNDESATGLPFGYVTQFAGPPASGKTQLALHLAASAELQQTWYICSSTPQVQRFGELCHHNDAIMQRTAFTTATDDYQVLQRLAELEAMLLECRPNDDGRTWKPVLLVLDSCSGCLAAAGEDSGGGLLMTVAATIRRLTRHFNLATVLINGTVSNRDTGSAAAAASNKSLRPTKAALGNRWNTAAADIAVWLEATGTAGTVRATLERHAAKRCVVDEGATFGIIARGIQDVP